MTNIPLTGPEAIAHALGRLDLLKLEEEQREVIRQKKKTARPRAVRVLRILQGLKRNDIKPSDLMTDSVPVIPPAFRPFSVTGNTFLPGDSNELYRDLVEYRGLYQNTLKELGPEAANNVYEPMSQAVRALYGYGDSPNPKIKSRSVKGFFDVVTGTSPKQSFYQSRMLAKPVDAVARGVIVPDADLDMNEVGLPVESAWSMYGSHIQRQLVLGGQSPAGALRALRDRTPQAKSALDKAMIEKPVVVSRAPAWHKFNVVGQRPRLVDGDAIRINTFISEGLGADYDGDSVDLETPIILRREGEVTLMTGLQIEAQFSTTSGDEIIEAPGFEAWTYSGWSRVVNFSLHACKSKRKYRITLRNGVSFIVSEDHSVMVGKREVKPTSLTVGAKLDVSDLVPAVGVGGDYDEGVIYGHFLGDGCAEMRYDTSGRVSIACKPDTEREYLKDLWRKQYDVHITDCGHGWFQATNGRIAESFLRLCGRYCGGKFIHSELLSRSREFLKGMLAGYILSDGSVETTRSGSYLVRTWSRSKALRDGMSLVASMLGLPHSIRERRAKGETNYIVSFGKEAIKLLDYRCPGKKGDRLRSAIFDYANNRKDARVSSSDRGYEIISIAEVVYNDRMIDLEVESGEHVFSIIGGVVLHNTMSVHLPSTPEAIKEVRDKLMPDKMVWSVKDRGQVMAAPKHEQILGLNMPTAGGPKKRFRSNEEVIKALEDGDISPSDDVEVSP